MNRTWQAEELARLVWEPWAWKKNPALGPASQRQTEPDQNASAKNFVLQFKRTPQLLVALRSVLSSWLRVLLLWLNTRIERNSGRNGFISPYNSTSPSSHNLFFLVHPQDPTWISISQYKKYFKQSNHSLINSNTYKAQRLFKIFKI